MNKTILPLIMAMSISLFAYSDYDMDGVDDGVDMCPNTLFSDLVNTSGCTIKSLESSYDFDIIFGIAYSDSSLDGSDTFTGSVQVDYYYEDFSFQASTSYNNAQTGSYDENDMDDSFLGASYKLNPAKDVLLHLGVGIIIPTYDNELNNNNTDYTASANVSYMLENMNIFCGYSYTIINDDDVQDTAYYQNTNSYNVGLGFFPTQKLYTSISYTNSDSVYKNDEDVETASVNLFYNISEKYFTRFAYAHGLSDSASDKNILLNFGLYF